MDEVSGRRISGIFFPLLSPFLDLVRAWRYRVKCRVRSIEEWNYSLGIYIVAWWDCRIAMR